MVHAIIPAAGRGERLGGAIRKQFLTIGGLPILVHTLAVFQASPLIDEIICVLPKEEIGFFEGLISAGSLGKIKQLLPGGLRRQDSVGEGLSYLVAGGADPNDLVAIHDGVRPLVTGPLIERVIETAREGGAAVASLPITDSLKRVSSDKIILDSFPRENIRAMQTPQVFRLGLLQEAYRIAERDRFEATDEAMLVARLGVSIRCVEGSSENIKITTAADLRMAEMILRARLDGENRGEGQ
ncbi:MAG: 2-C-methyl-D-erythritol 4-phosphate cytidylyltransferase [Candidatus Manganitrophaceae bacterium]